LHILAVVVVRGTIYTLYDIRSEEIASRVILLTKMLSGLHFFCSDSTVSGIAFAIRIGTLLVQYPAPFRIAFVIYKVGFLQMTFP